MGTYFDLIVYKKAFSLAMRIHEYSKHFPAEESYSLTDQIRRSSRSVCANLAESYIRRKYKNYFQSKLNDVQCENTETQVWLDFAKYCGYLSDNIYLELSAENDEVGKLTRYIINNPEKFL